MARNEGRVPVLIGVGRVEQYEDDPARALEALELMAHAADDALADADADAGSAVRDHVDWIGVPEGTWGYRDPGRLLAHRLHGPTDHSDAVTTVVADVGILQQDLLDAACDAVTRGGARVALVVGGEAKHRALLAAKAGIEVAETVQAADVTPDVAIRPSSLGVSDLEIIRNTVAPPAAYALIENAIAHAKGRTLDAHRDVLARRWARFAAVASANPHAWDRVPHTPSEIRDADVAAGNRMISFPYTKRLCAQWNVDQAAALLFCSLETARTLGVADDRLVFPRASVVANHAVPLTARVDLHRSIGAELAGARLLEVAGLEPGAVAAGAIDQLDLYSCFPSAVGVYAEALGLDPDAAWPPLTVTGGLAFAGGPLNNYVLQALVELAQRLRGHPGQLGLSSSVSGFLVKQGFSLWSASPPPGGFVADDVSEQARLATATVAVLDRAGAGPVVSWTVDFAGADPARAVAVVELGGGVRTIGVSTDPTVAAALLAEDPIGSRAVVAADGSLTVPSR